MRLVRLSKESASMLSRVERNQERLLEAVRNLEETIMGLKEDMKVALAENSSATQSVATLVAKLADQVQDLKNNGLDPDEVQSWIDATRADTLATVEAVKRGTPIEAEPAPVPVEPDVVEEPV